MANTYDSSLLTPKDRIRFWIGDRSAPWSFSDEEIAAVLDGGTSEADEIRAAIALLEGEDRGVTSESRRQGSWARSVTYSGGGGGRLARLRARLVEIDQLALANTDYSPVGAADMEFPEPEDHPRVTRTIYP